MSCAIGRANDAAGTVSGRLHHHDDGVFRIFIRRKGREPIILADVWLWASCTSAVPVLAQIFKPSTAAAVPVPSLLSRRRASRRAGFAGCADARPVVAHHAGRKIGHRFTGRRVLRLNPVNQPRPQHLSAVGNRRKHTAIWMGVTATSPWPMHTFAVSPSVHPEWITVLSGKSPPVSCRAKSPVRSPRWNSSRCG